MQVVSSGTGLGMRGAKVILHEHFDGTQALRWRQRKLTYTVLTKAQRQAAQVDGKKVNTRVDEALAKRGQSNKTVHKPALDHPWRKYPDGKPATGRCNVMP